MRGRRVVLRCGGARATAPAPAYRLRRPHALGSSAGVRGHGTAGRAGGSASASRPQAPPYHTGMGEAAETAGYGGTSAGDGGAGDESALRRRRREARPAAQHTAARRRVRPGRTSPDTSPLSARRADEKQFPTSTEQMRERRAGVGGRDGRAAGTPGGRRRGEEGRAAAEGDPLVGPHGRPAAARLPPDQRTPALRDGAAPRRALAAARRVTERPAAPPSYHAYIPLSGRSDSPECTRPRPGVL
ncbi:serine/arginine repetitive matrix protein 3 isoform X3 [Danaus plexippus]|uniref:serine/arginine repetitive matrix protein 3 isoform X3 n=1 Tax=Danaus plexippus TaxID=13037 RepID=UPI002AB2738C|nr:serine/arginine repetitive matrix protein 3 isoform X3 [Danaus plexippus]